MKNILNAILLFALIITLTISLACNKNTDCFLPEGGCNCPSGYEGADCAIKTTEKFLGRFRDSTTYLFIKDSVTTTARVIVLIDTKSDGTGGYKMSGIVSGTHIDIPTQNLTFGPKPTFIKGEICLEKSGDGLAKMITKLQTYDTPNVPPSAFVSRRVWVKN